MKKLPLDVQAFEKMRGENYLYVDKTRHIHKIISASISMWKPGMLMNGRLCNKEEIVCIASP